MICIKSCYRYTCYALWVTDRQSCVLNPIYLIKLVQVFLHNCPKLTLNLFSSYSAVWLPSFFLIPTLLIYSQRLISHLLRLLQYLHVSLVSKWSFSAYEGYISNCSCVFWSKLVISKYSKRNFRFSEIVCSLY